MVNGTWSGGKSADKTVEVEKGTAPTNIPTGMIALAGYEGGSWDVNPETAVINGTTTFTYTFIKSPTKIEFDCDDFIKIMRIEGMTNDPDILPYSKEIEVTINNERATSEQLDELIDNATFEIYNYGARDFVNAPIAEAAFHLSKSEDERRLKITAKKSAIVKITFTSDGATYTQLVCTPGDINNDLKINEMDLIIFEDYLDDMLSDVFVDLKYQNYDMFLIMADMDSDNVTSPKVNEMDYLILQDILDEF